jgi:hypothetical protein
MTRKLRDFRPTTQRLVEEAVDDAVYFANDMQKDGETIDHDALFTVALDMFNLLLDPDGDATFELPDSIKAAISECVSDQVVFKLIRRA